MSPQLIDLYTDLLKEEGCDVQVDRAGVIEFELANQKFQLFAISSSRSRICHSLTLPNEMGTQKDPRILEAVNLTNLLYPQFQTTAFGGGASIMSNCETDPTLGLFRLKSLTEEMLEAASELHSNLSTKDF